MPPSTPERRRGRTSSWLVKAYDVLVDEAGSFLAEASADPEIGRELVHDLYLAWRRQELEARCDGPPASWLAALVSARERLVEEGRGRAPFPENRVAVHLPQAHPLYAAMEELRASYPRAWELVALRFYGRLTVDQAAAALELSPRTAAREWRRARGVLRRALTNGDGTS